MITIEVDEAYQPAVETVILEDAARAVIEHQGAPARTSLALVITGDEQLQELNSRYLGIDAPTDVLAFPSNETDPETDELYLGDILISYPHASAQASQAGHPISAELQLLVVHGVLHLLGHDHSEEAEKDRMWAAQEEILARLGSSANPPP